jgi:hypothetical protein
MNIHILSKNHELVEPISKLFSKQDVKIFNEQTFEDFFKNCIHSPSNIFFIQADIDSESRVLNSIKDLRQYFGAFPIIIVIGKKAVLGNTTNYLNVGADNTFPFPYDSALMEDFFQHNLQRDFLLPIQYRNLPSGGSPIEMRRPISLSQISSEGIDFQSVDFITRGTVFTFDISEFFQLSKNTVKCRVLTSDSNDEDDIYNYHAEFYQIADELKKEIRFQLKKS